MIDKAYSRGHSIAVGPIILISGLFSIAEYLLLSGLIVRITPVESRLLAISILVVCTTGLVVATIDGARLCQIIYWSFTLCWLGIAPIYQLAENAAAWKDVFVFRDKSSVMQAQLMLLVAISAYLAGSLAYRFKKQCPTRVRPAATVSRQSAVRLSTFLLAGSIVLFPVAALAAGGLGGLFGSRLNRSVSAASAEGVGDTSGPLDGISRILPATMVAITFFAAASIFFYDRLQRRRPQEWRLDAVCLVLAAFLMCVILANPIANSRFISLSAFGAGLIALYHPIRRRAAVTVTLLCMSAFLLFYPLADIFRSSVSLSNLRGFSLAEWSGPNFDGFQQWVNTIQYTESAGYLYGKSIYSAVLFFVPRSIWEGKSVPASIEIAEFKNYYFTNLSLPFSAEIFLNLGIIGMVVVMAFYGYLSSMADNRWVRGQYDRFSCMIPVFATQQVGFLRGPLGSLLVVSLVALALAALFSLRFLQTHQIGSHERMDTRDG